MAMQPGPEHKILESLVEHAYTALIAAGFIPTQSARPGQFDVGGVTYYASRATLTVPTQL